MTLPCRRENSIARRCVTVTSSALPGPKESHSPLLHLLQLRVKEDVRLRIELTTLSGDADLYGAWGFDPSFENWDLCAVRAFSFSSSRRVII